MSKFQVGQRVKCVNASEGQKIQIGGEYTIAAMDGSYLQVGELLPELPLHKYRHDRFIPVAEPAPWTPTVGDVVECVPWDGLDADKYYGWVQSAFGHNSGKHKMIAALGVKNVWFDDNMKDGATASWWPTCQLKLIRPASDPAPDHGDRGKADAPIIGHHPFCNFFSRPVEGCKQCAAIRAKEEIMEVEKLRLAPPPEPPAHICPLCSGPCGALPPFTELERLATHTDIIRTRRRDAERKAALAKELTRVQEAGELKRLEDGGDVEPIYDNTTAYTALTGHKFEEE